MVSHDGRPKAKLSFNVGKTTYSYYKDDAISRKILQRLDYTATPERGT